QRCCVDVQGAIVVTHRVVAQPCADGVAGHDRVIWPGSRYGCTRYSTGRHQRDGCHAVAVDETTCCKLRSCKGNRLAVGLDPAVGRYRGTLCIDVQGAVAVTDDVVAQPTAYDVAGHDRVVWSGSGY